MHQNTTLLLKPHYFSKFRLQPYMALLFLTLPFSISISYFICIASLHNHTNKEWQLVHLITVRYKVGAWGAQLASKTLVYLVQTMNASKFFFLNIWRTGNLIAVVHLHMPECSTILIAPTIRQRFCILVHTLIHTSIMTVGIVS